MPEPAATHPDGSALLAALRGLATAAPGTLADAVLDRWTELAAPTVRDGVLGPVLVAWTRAGVSYLRTTASQPGPAFREAYRHRFGRPLQPAAEVPEDLVAALAGRGPAPAVDLAALTGFERDVLAATATIPAGETRAYGWVAREVGRPRAVRAAASALARNPVPLLVPCHRVVRGDGDPGRYVFGDAGKLALLRAEGALPGLRGDGVTG